MDLTKAMRRAQHGDEAAFATIVVATQAEIWRFCAHLVGSSEADDITQETYLAAWRSLANYRGEAAPRTWLFAIAKRLALHNERRTIRWRELATPAATSEHALTSDPHHAHAFNEALGALSPDRRLTLLLTQVFGFSYEETANICDCSLGTVRSRVARGRRDLMELLAETPLPQSDDETNSQAG